MTVTSVEKDPHGLTLTITAELDAPAARVWGLWEDPRQLERWWGPPTWPATFVDHELTPGAVSRYFMSGPEGERSHGWFRIVAVDEPARLELEDGFADGDGEPDPSMPVMVIVVTITEQAGGPTRMAVATTFPSTEAMERLLTMGMDEGMAAAMGQIEDVLDAG